MSDQASSSKNHSFQEDDPDSGGSSPLSPLPASQKTPVVEKKAKKRSATESQRGESSPTKRIKMTKQSRSTVAGTGRRSSTIVSVPPEDDLPASAPTPPHAPTPIESAPTPPPPLHSPSPAPALAPPKGKSNKRLSQVEKKSSATTGPGPSKSGLKIKLKVNPETTSQGPSEDKDRSVGRAIKKVKKDVKRRVSGLEQEPADDEDPEGEALQYEEKNKGKGVGKREAPKEKQKGKANDIVDAEQDLPNEKKKDIVEGERDLLKDKRKKDIVEGERDLLKDKRKKDIVEGERDLLKDKKKGDKGEKGQKITKTDKVHQESKEVNKGKGKTSELVNEESIAQVIASPNQSTSDDLPTSTKPVKTKKVKQLPTIEKHPKMPTPRSTSPAGAEKSLQAAEEEDTTKLKTEDEKTDLKTTDEEKIKLKTTAPSAGSIKKVNPALKRAAATGAGTPKPKSLLGDAMALLSTPLQATGSSKVIPAGSEKKDVPKQRRYGAWTDTWVLTPEEEATKASQQPRREAMKARIAAWKINPVNLQDAKYVYRMDAKTTTRVELPRGQNDGRGIYTEGAAGNLVRHFLAVNKHRQREEQVHNGNA
ncbi:hypothetical protein BCR39DRAFT_511335 [Naematelia encephala]|uniref:Uncharacterized protein n=1 Tax=Naematelia encephala TaxID=71784 RepID=A0A1Y2BLL3_9TREE|nr:hypothetical protein BCR39DRAFT_511335 [Naematelia encephala]